MQVITLWLGIVFWALAEFSNEMNYAYYWHIDPISGAFSYFQNYMYSFVNPLTIPLSLKLVNIDEGIAFFLNP